MKNEVKRTAHSSYRCEYYLVFAPKYRRKVIDRVVSFGHRRPQKSGSGSEPSSPNMGGAEKGEGGVCGGNRRFLTTRRASAASG